MTERTYFPQPLTEPGIASAEEGFVVLDGPDGLAITMTAGAAAQTGRNLICAAQIAKEQAAEKHDGDSV
jgi:hypothetical protein